MQLCSCMHQHAGFIGRPSLIEFVTTVCELWLARHCTLQVTFDLRLATESVQVNVHLVMQHICCCHISTLSASGVKIGHMRICLTGGRCCTDLRGDRAGTHDQAFVKLTGSRGQDQ